MGLIKDCEKFFDSANLYDVLSISKSATAAQLKQAYKKASLQFHPDRTEEANKKISTRKFQILSHVYKILSDAEQRAIYDKQGIVDDESTGFSSDCSGDEWVQYWRSIFPKITMKDIDNFMAKYEGSEEELNDLKKSYLKHKGDMNLISEDFIGYRLDTEDRICEILHDLIKKKEVPGFKKFTQEPAAKKASRIKKLKKEAVEAQDMDLENNLLQAISLRQKEREQNFNDMIANLEQKYGKPKKTQKKK